MSLPLTRTINLGPIRSFPASSREWARGWTSCREAGPTAAFIHDIGKITVSLRYWSSSLRGHGPGQLVFLAYVAFGRVSNNLRDSSQTKQYLHLSGKHVSRLLVTCSGHLPNCRSPRVPPPTTANTVNCLSDTHSIPHICRKSKAIVILLLLTVLISYFFAHGGKYMFLQLPASSRALGKHM